MVNLRRYSLDDFNALCARMVEDKDGEYVKFADVKKLLQTSNNKQSAPCPHFYRGTDGVHVCIVDRCNHPDCSKWTSRT
jgi:hypothetical protein